MFFFPWVLANFILLAFIVVIFGFMLSLGRSLSVLIVLENFNILILFCCLVSVSEENRGLFISLLVLFTVEVTLCLVVLTRLWSTLSSLDLGILF